MAHATMASTKAVSSEQEIDSISSSVDGAEIGIRGTRYSKQMHERKKNYMYMYYLAVQLPLMVIPLEALPTVLSPLCRPKYQEYEGAEPISVAGHLFRIRMPLCCAWGNQWGPAPNPPSSVTGASPLGGGPWKRDLKPRKKKFRSVQPRDAIQRCLADDW